jgi:hypothetical protein
LPPEFAWVGKLIHRRNGMLALQVASEKKLSLPCKGLPPLEIPARMRNFSLIRPPNHLAVYGGLGEFPKKSG